MFHSHTFMFVLENESYPLEIKLKIVCVWNGINFSPTQFGIGSFHAFVPNVHYVFSLLILRLDINFIGFIVRVVLCGFVLGHGALSCCYVSMNSLFGVYVTRIWRHESG